jgi:hypothetical protein
MMEADEIRNGMFVKDRENGDELYVLKVHRNSRVDSFKIGYDFNKNEKTVYDDAMKKNLEYVSPADIVVECVYPNGSQSEQVEECNSYFFPVTRLEKSG